MDLDILFFIVNAITAWALLVTFYGLAQLSPNRSSDTRPMRILRGLLMASLIVWPFMAPLVFFSLFAAHDAVFQNPADKQSANVTAHFVFFYPVILALTWIVYMLIKRLGLASWWRFAAFLIPLVSYTLVIPPFFSPPDPTFVNRKRVEILFQTDHNAVLQAGREVFANKAILKQPEKRHENSIDPDDPRLPKVITSLRPIRIIRYKDNLRLTFLSSPHYYLGLKIQSEESASTYETKYVKSKIGYRKILLATGLLYYDRRLEYEDRQEFANRLRAMQPTNSPPPNW